ncbi:hypothetical protein MAR_001423 [Mya arenaria]|uniref:THAP-type domain-containing protein n=1 Tax=Mya arenaria TaxID=6604 RepID=A0ABY7FBS9_MYAAR|nr:uncharacterized protein LOC128208502 [Mya arenaria]WAR19585.1 hypothetical protein MAR_001423 [Mya arenaria]
MVNSCSVFKCHNKANKSDNRKFFRLPEIILHQDDRTRELSTERRRSWLARLGQDFTGKNLSNIRVCSDHFISGQKSALYDRENPDWAPSINLGSTASTPSPLVATGRFARRRARSEKCEAARVLLSIGESCEPSLEEEAGTSSQTDLSSLVIDSVFNELAHVKKENDSFREQLKTQTPYCIEFFKENDDKVKYFTGLTSFLVLMELFGYLEGHLPAKVLLSKFQCLIMTLMKLRLDLSNVFLAYQFSVSTSTISRTFEDYIHVMYHRMKPLVYWPDRESLQKTMPMQFREHFGKKCAVIIDCFEVFIDKPSNMLARAETWSSYKHHNTVKFLIGITPQGVISYISNAWGGRTTDKHITEHSGFLDNILPGDLVMADRGFDIAASVGTLCAQVKIPAFTKGKSQMSPLDLESTRKLANVRIHVERVIGLTRQKYTILNGLLPVEFLLKENGQDLPVIDKIGTVCCALVNLCDPVVAFD